MLKIAVSEIMLALREYLILKYRKDQAVWKDMCLVDSSKGTSCKLAPAGEVYLRFKLNLYKL